MGAISGVIVLLVVERSFFRLPRHNFTRSPRKQLWISQITEIKALWKDERLITVATASQASSVTSIWTV